MPTEEQTLDSRITIVEYRQDKSEEAHAALRKDYTEEHRALRQSLQGIEKNLSAIKWVAFGAALVTISQALGIDKAAAILKAFL